MTRVDPGKSIGSLSKRDREGFWMALFQDLCPDSPHGEPRRAPDEEVDFLLDMRSGTLAVELTEFFRDESCGGSRLAGRWELIRRIKDDARDFLASSGWTGRFGFMVSDDAEFGKADVQPVGTEIGRLVLRECMNDEERRLFRGDSLPESLRHFLEHVEGTRKICESKARAAYGTGGVLHPTSNSIRLRIQKKEKKLAAYRAHGDAVWLVLYADHHKPACQPPTSEELELPEISTGFDRIYFLTRGWIRRIA